MRKMLVRFCEGLERDSWTMGKPYCGTAGKPGG